MYVQIEPSSHCKAPCFTKVFLSPIDASNMTNSHSPIAASNRTNLPSATACVCKTKILKFRHQGISGLLESSSSNNTRTNSHLGNVIRLGSRLVGGQLTLLKYNLYSQQLHASLGPGPWPGRLHDDARWLMADQRG